MTNTKQEQKRRVLINSTVDLDTCGAAFFLGVTPEDEVVAICGEASAEDLNNVETICIKVGGAGRPIYQDWDRDAVNGPRVSVTLQLWSQIPHYGNSRLIDFTMARFVDYINTYVTRPEKLRHEIMGDFHLSQCFAGMLLTESDPVKQLHKGVEILVKIYQSGQFAVEDLKGFELYAKAIAEHDSAKVEA